jgi:hypothetical protein
MYWFLESLHFDHSLSQMEKGQPNSADESIWNKSGLDVQRITMKEEIDRLAVEWKETSRLSRTEGSTQVYFIPADIPTAP